jgi:hypothetical protein
MSQFIQNFDKMSTKEIISTTILNESVSLEKNVNDIVNYILKIVNEGKDPTLSNNIIDYFNYYNIKSKEIYGWLLINQNNSDYIFLLGYFNYFGIETTEDHRKAFDLFISASEQNHALAQFYVGICYETGHGTIKDENLAFKYYKKIAKKSYAMGLLKAGYCYYNGIGHSINKQKAIELFQQVYKNKDLPSPTFSGRSLESLNDGVIPSTSSAENLMTRSVRSDGSFSVSCCF